MSGRSAMLRRVSLLVLLHCALAQDPIPDIGNVGSALSPRFDNRTIQQWLADGALESLQQDDPATLQDVLRCVRSFNEASKRLPPDATSEWSYNYNQCFGPLYDSNAAPTSCSEECRAAFQLLSARCTLLLFRFYRRGATYSDEASLPEDVNRLQDAAAAIARPCELEVPASASEQRIGLSGWYACMGLMQGPEGTTAFSGVSSADDLPWVREAVCNPAEAITCTCEAAVSEGGGGCCLQAGAGNVSWVELELPEPLRVQGVTLTAPAGGDCDGGGEPCAHRLLGTWVFVSNYSLIYHGGTAQYQALLELAGLEGGTDANNVLQLAHYAAANMRASLCNVVTPFDLYDEDGALQPNGTVWVGCGRGLLGRLGTGASLPADLASAVADPGGSPDLILPPEIAAALPPDIAGKLGAAVRPAIAAEEPAGRYIVFARSSGGDRGPLALCDVRVCGLPLNVSTRDVQRLAHQQDQQAFLDAFQLGSYAQAAPSSIST